MLSVFALHYWEFVGRNLLQGNNIWGLIVIVNPSWRYLILRGSGLGLLRYWFIIWSLCRLSLSLLSFMRMASLTSRLKHVGSLLITSHRNFVFSRSSRGWDLT